jgi:hypothetical protein
MQIQTQVMRELRAWIAARREAKLVESLLRDAPEDAVLLARRDTASGVVREAVAVLRAALAARGHTLEQLQAELRQGPAAAHADAV